METTKWRKRHGNFRLDDARAHRKSPLKNIQIAGSEWPPNRTCVCFHQKNTLRHILHAYGVFAAPLCFIFYMLLCFMFLGTPDNPTSTFDTIQCYCWFSSGSRNFREGGGARNMKYKPPRMAAIFFGSIFTGWGGGMAPLAPPPRGSATVIALALVR